MKRLSLILISTLISISANAQWINALTVVPANPTTADTIRVYAALSFPSGDCQDKTQFFSVAGNHIFANALHCLGMATFICSSSDTFTIAPLSSGTYTFVLQVDAGASPGPCTPGIAPGTIDSVTFTVTQSSSLPEIPEGAFFSIYPVPANNTLTVITRDEPAAGTIIELFDASGKLVISEKAAGRSTTIFITTLPAANYIIRITSPGIKPAEQKFTIIR